MLVHAPRGAAKLGALVQDVFHLIQVVGRSVCQATRPRPLLC
jgi:hypothetical protein